VQQSRHCECTMYFKPWVPTLCLKWYQCHLFR
jgi:hypothetical protein